MQLLLIHKHTYLPFLYEGDIYHLYPPYLTGSYNFFSACPLWDDDAANLLGEGGKGKMVRVVGKMKKIDGKPGGYRVVGQHWMEIFRVWECGWEEVERARGAVCGW